MFTSIDAISERYDIIVVGSGAAGMAAALFAALEGRKVLMVERSEYVGGTSALSAGTTWIPNSHHSSSVNSDDSPEKARKFLDGVVGNHSPAAMREAFLASAPDAVATLEANSEVKFRPYATHPDYEQQVEGATMRGRALEPVPFDGRKLGVDLNKNSPANSGVHHSRRHDGRSHRYRSSPRHREIRKLLCPRGQDSRPFCRRQAEGPPRIAPRHG